ncbi:Lumazine-binding protein [Gloeothece verrucosa]|uniref:Lumazine-binding protein n=1 Tax=Gloeothece verrucosa (strain PCC 7822) TaxID=497965 RepID=E0UIH5_GLOV7|nr:Lumazine-binding protein [Gloeothece verrucosa]ADN12169.1 Lumazine-binding protein [Gloeothece verrucosa PCC 7822]
MFTGIIKETGLITQVNQHELIINVGSELFSDLPLQSSVALNGKVLTLVDKFSINDQFCLKFHLHSLSSFRANTRVNLERAVRLGEEISSSLFLGIPSGRCQLISLIHESETSVLFEVVWEDVLLKYLDPKDLVCLDGVLLMINKIEERVLSLGIYEETLKLTNLGERRVGDWLNIEMEPMVKKLAQILEKKFI